MLVDIDTQVYCFGGEEQRREGKRRERRVEGKKRKERGEMSSP